MEEKIAKIKSFLEGIPQFIKGVDSDHSYVKVPNGPIGSRMYITSFSIEDVEDGNGFIVTGRLSVPLLDLISFPGWHSFKQKHLDVFDDELYEEYLKINKNLVRDFELDVFINNFPDYFQEFIDENGIKDEDLKIKENTILFMGNI